MKISILKVYSVLCILFIVQMDVSAQSFTSSNLPIVVINTNGKTIVDDPKISADMGIIYNGVGVRNNVTDPFNNFSGKIGIEVRGSTSQELFPKKQYGIEIQDATGAGIDASLLGLPKKDDWVLFAPYDDKSLMRDVLAYKLGRDMGRYASRSKYCEVIINGQYQGIYVLLEKVKRDKNRVNIDKLDPNETTGDNLTGGYIIKLDKTTGGDGLGWASPIRPVGASSNQVTFFQYEYPKSDEITIEQKQYIKDYITAFETTLNSSNFKDPDQGYQKYIDVNSFIDFFLANELTKNPDAYRLSTYMSKRKDSDGGKLFMGPIWDFNLGFGNVDFCLKGKPEGFVIDYNSICPADGWLVPFWWKRLLQDDAFKAKVVSRWTSLRQGVYQTSRITTYIDSVATVLNVEAQQRNFTRWPVLGVYVWPNYYVGPSFQSEVDYLKDWTTKRLTWIDQNIASVVTGIEKNSIASVLRTTVSPNPYKEQVQVEYEIDQPGSVEIELIDLTGRKLEAIATEHLEPGKYDVAVGREAHSAGMYFVKINFNSNIQIIKVIRR